MNTNVAPSSLTLQNATVVLPDRIMDAGTVIVESGRIVSVGDSETTNGEVLDLSGLTLLPGFIDVHIHGAVGVDVMEATPRGLIDVSEYLAAQGVTSWLPTLVPG